MTIKKGIAVLNGTTVVHQFKDDGDALVGKDGQRVDLKGSVYIDGVTGHAGNDLATTINDIMSADQSDLATQNTAAQAAEAAIASSITAEANRAAAEEDAIALATGDEYARATTAEAANAADLATQEAAAKAAEGTLSTNIGLEAIRAGGAETTNTNATTAENTRATTAEGVLTTNLSAQSVAAQAAEAVLQADVDQNEADFDAAILAREKAAKAAEATLTSDLSAQSVAAQAAEAANTAALVAQSAQAVAAETANAADLATQEAAAQAAEAVLDAARAAQTAASQTAEAGLQSQLDTITDVLNDPKTLETFKDVIADFADQDAATETSITNALDAHQAAREQATQDGIDRVAALQATEDSNEATFDAAISAQSGAAVAAEAGLSSTLSSNSAASLAAEVALQADVDQNEADFDSAIAAVLADAQANQSSFDTAVVNENTRANQAEKSVESLLAAEKTRAQDAENAIATALDDEGVGGQTQNAQAAEVALQADVDQNEADFDSAVAAIQADEDQNELDGDQAIKAYESELQASNATKALKLSNEAATENGNEADFDTALAAQVAASTAAESALDAARVAQTAAAESAEATLTADLATQVAAAKAAESANAAAIAAQNLSATTAEAAMLADLNSQIASATAAELVLTNDLAAHTSAAQAAEAAIQADIDVLLDISNPAIAGSMKEVVDAFEAMDATMIATHTANVATYQSELQAQIDAATAEEVSLQQEEDSNEATFDANIAAQEAATVAWEDSYFAGFSALVGQNNGDTADRDTQTIALDPAGNDVSGLAEFNVGSLDSSGPITTYPLGDSMIAGQPVPASYTDAATLASGANDGIMFYYSGTSTSDFPLSDKHYFCENGTWYASPFYTPPTTYDTTALFAAIDAAQAWVDGGGSDAGTAESLMFDIMDEMDALSPNPMVSEGLIDAAYPPPAHQDLMQGLQAIANPPQPEMWYRVTPTAGYGSETILIINGVVEIAPTFLGIGGVQWGNGPGDNLYNFPVGSEQWDMSDNYGDGAYTIDFLNSDGSIAHTMLHSAGFKYSDGQLESFTVSFDGTTLTVDGTACATFDPVTGEFTAI